MMIIPRKQDALHKAWLYRLLRAIADDAKLASILAFKGGTCAAMLGWLDRFSIDLDFDYLGDSQAMKETQERLEIIFTDLGLEIKDQSKIIAQYFLRYPAEEGKRNTLKLDLLFPPPKSNRYQKLRFVEIDRVLQCQTKETMLANKLVALIDRYEQQQSIAGRDLYDIHYFLMRGGKYEAAVIEERRGKPVIESLLEISEFIKEKITQKIIDQDLNTLLTPKQFQRIRKILKEETLSLLNDEISRLK